MSKKNEKNNPESTLIASVGITGYSTNDDDNLKIDLNMTKPEWDEDSQHNMLELLKGLADFLTEELLDWHIKNKKPVISIYYHRSDDKLRYKGPYLKLIKYLPVLRAQAEILILSYASKARVFNTEMRNVVVDF